jgi:hypothetical protein
MNNAGQITQGQSGSTVTKDLITADIFSTSDVIKHILSELDALDCSQYTNTQTFKVTVTVEPTS